ncbi:MAG: S41 family peptidase [Candidatus Sulfopaludibacter sp.]|nr:S41 family peptidase [Candidatus Sulfopaludibacter sp.]
MRFTAKVSLLLVAACACAADDVRLTPEERQGEVEWLTSLGLKVPEGGPLLETPFTPPFTARSFLTPESWWRLPQPKDVAANALRQDVALLRVVMEKAYGGWASAQKRGWDWNRWFAEWDQELAGRGTAKLALADALAPFGTLQGVQLDNHSGPVGLPFFSSGSRTAVLDATPQGACTQMRTVEGAIFTLDQRDPAQAPKKAQILLDVNAPEREAYYLAYPAKRGIVNGVQCAGKWITAWPTWAHSKRLLIAHLAGTASDTPSYRAISKDMGYLRLPSFTKENGELLRQLLAALPESAGHEKLLIIDLRSNEGGDAPVDELARWIDLPSAQRVMQGLGGYRPQSCLYTALRWGYEQVTLRGLNPRLSDSLRDSLQKELDGLFAPPVAGCPVSVRETKTVWAYREHHVTTQPPAGKPRLLVLVDNECGSDCEFMTYVLAAESGSVIAGENTFGVGQFIQPGYFILPNTRLQFRIALGMSDIYGDGRSVDGYGLDVDIVLPSEEAQGGPAILRLAGRLLEQLR